MQSLTLLALERSVLETGPTAAAATLRSQGPLAALVSRAILADAPALRRDPGLLFQCLWNRLAFEGPEPRALVERWRAERPAAPWLESLRPPPGRLDQQGERLDSLGQEVHCIAASRDAARIAVGLWEGVRTYALTSGQVEHALLPSDETEVLGIDWDPAGERIAAGTRGHEVRVFEARTGELAWQGGGHEGRVTSVEWSPDGTRLAAGNLGWMVRLYSRAGEELAALEGHQQSVLTVAWHPGGELLASGASDGTVRLWDTTSGQCRAALPVGEHATVQSVAFSPDGSRIAAVGRDGVTLWRTGTWAHLRTIPHADATTSVAWLDADRLLIQVWQRLLVHGADAPAPELELPLPPSCFVVPLGTARAAIATQKGDVELRELVATPAAPPSQPREPDPEVVGLWADPRGVRAIAAVGSEFRPEWRPLDLATGELGAAIPLEQPIMARPEETAIDADARRAACQLDAHGDAPRLAAFDLASGRELASWPWPPLPDHLRWGRPWLAWHPDGAHLLSLAPDLVLRIHALERGRPVVEVPLGTPPEDRPAHLKGVGLLPAGDLLLFGREADSIHEAEVAVWRLGPRRARLLEERAGGILEPTVALAGGRFAAAREDGQVRVWDLDAARLLTTLRAEETVCSLALAPDGSELAIALPRCVRVHRLPGGEPRVELPAPDWIDSLALRADRLAARTRDARLLVWDLAAGGEPVIVPGQADPAAALDRPLWLAVEQSRTTVRRGLAGELVAAFPEPLEARLLPGPVLLARGQGDRRGAAYLLRLHGVPDPHAIQAPAPVPLDVSPAARPGRGGEERPKGYTRW